MTNKRQREVIDNKEPSYKRVCIKEDDTLSSGSVVDEPEEVISEPPREECDSCYGY